MASEAKYDWDAIYQDDEEDRQSALGTVSFVLEGPAPAVVELEYVSSDGGAMEELLNVGSIASKVSKILTVQSSERRTGDCVYQCGVYSGGED